MNVIPICADEEGVLPASLKHESPHLVYTTPSHQFPLGTIMTIARRQAVVLGKRGKFIYY